jgi:hypothetical protein
METLLMPCGSAYKKAGKEMKKEAPKPSKKMPKKAAGYGGKKK